MQVCVPVEVQCGLLCAVCVLCGCVNSGPRQFSARDFIDSPLSTNEHIQGPLGTKASHELGLPRPSPGGV